MSKKLKLKKEEVRKLDDVEDANLKGVAGGAMSADKAWRAAAKKTRDASKPLGRPGITGDGRTVRGRY
jgi:hypothetical protein